MSSSANSTPGGASDGPTGPQNPSIAPTTLPTAPMNQPEQVQLPLVQQHVLEIELARADAAQLVDPASNLIASTFFDPATFATVNDTHGTGPQHLGGPDHRAILINNDLMLFTTRANKQMWLVYMPIFIQYLLTMPQVMGTGGLLVGPEIVIELRMHGPLDNPEVPARDIVLTERRSTSLAGLPEEIRLKLDRFVLDRGLYDVGLTVNGIVVANFPAQILVKHDKYDSRKNKGNSSEEEDDQDGRWPHPYKRTKSGKKLRARRARTSSSMSPTASTSYDSSSSADMSPLTGYAPAAYPSASTSSSSSSSSAGMGSPVTYASTASASASASAFAQAFNVVPQAAWPQQASAAAFGFSSNDPMATALYPIPMPLPHLAQQLQQPYYWPNFAGSLYMAPTPTFSNGPAPSPLHPPSAAQLSFPVSTLSLAPQNGLQQFPSTFDPLDMQMAVPQYSLDLMSMSMSMTMPGAGAELQATQSPMPMSPFTLLSPNLLPVATNVPVNAAPAVTLPPLSMYQPGAGTPIISQSPVTDLEPVESPASVPWDMSRSSSPDTPSLTSFFSVSNVSSPILFATQAGVGRTPPPSAAYLQSPLLSASPLEDGFTLGGEASVDASADAQDEVVDDFMDMLLLD